jgi:hypothetical protein
MFASQPTLRRRMKIRTQIAMCTALVAIAVAALGSTQAGAARTPKNGFDVALQPVTPNPSSGVQFRAGAFRAWPAEWADVTCASDDRVTRVKEPAAKGRLAYRVQLQEGDESYGERCELAMANTSSTNIDRVGGERVLFQNETESWIAQQIMLDPDIYAFCGIECPFEYDGGLIQQLKQTGSCGTPVNGIVTRNIPDIGVVLEHRNSAENDCGNDTMRSLWRVPIQRGSWVRILQHVRWSVDPNVGYIATWINDRAVDPSLDGDSRPVTRLGDEVRIHTWTLKDGPGVDHLLQCRSYPCAHLRNGVYRDARVHGDSVVYIDGTTVANTRAAAEAGAALDRPPARAFSRK